MKNEGLEAERCKKLTEDFKYNSDETIEICDMDGTPCLKIKYGKETHCRYFEVKQ